MYAFVITMRHYTGTILTVALCLVSVTSRCSVKTDEPIELVFGIVLGGNLGISKNMCTLLWKFVTNSTENFATASR